MTNLLKYLKLNAYSTSKSTIKLSLHVNVTFKDYGKMTERLPNGNFRAGGRE
jgi:hypothetical protein